MARRSRSRRRKEAQVAENHDRWLITYADLITLLLIFFVVMYAMSKVDVSKYDVLSQALKLEFKRSDSLMPQGSGLTGANDPARLAQELARRQQELDKQLKQEEQLENLVTEVQDYISRNNLQAQVSTTNTERGVAITLNDLFLFDLGKADLKPGSLPILNQLASLLQSLDAAVSIEGHTDDVPLATGSIYRDNWGLSQARSLSVLRYFVESTGLNHQQFISTAYADTKPLVENNSPENRAKNRRVEIVVLRLAAQDAGQAGQGRPAPAGQTGQ